MMHGQANEIYLLIKYIKAFSGENKSLVNDFVYSFGRAALLLLVEV